MTDRPIIFSSEMVLALIEGRKTQTRRKRFDRAGKPTPLSAVRPYDRLYVRETLVISPRNRWTYAADGAEVDMSRCPEDAEPYSSGSLAGMFMPRWASRLTLNVETTRVDRLHNITADDARAEGLKWIAPTYGVVGVAASWNEDPRQSFAALWNHLHGVGAWDRNPEIVAVTFSVRKGNIDG